jgi:flagellar biogenesis protein FliO
MILSWIGSSLFIIIAAMIHLCYVFVSFARTNSRARQPDEMRIFQPQSLCGVNVIYSKDC